MLQTKTVPQNITEVNKWTKVNKLVPRFEYKTLNYFEQICSLAEKLLSQIISNSVEIED